MKTNYSRRELYALGEPIGESSTRIEVDRRVYGGGGGILGDVTGAIGDLGQGAIDVVKDTGSTLDDLAHKSTSAVDTQVRKTIPGGWATVAALAGANGAGLFDAAAAGGGAGAGYEAGVGGTNLFADGAIPGNAADLAGAGGIDLGGGISLGADGSVLGGTFTGGSGLTGNAATDALTGLSGGSGVGGYLSNLLGKSITGSPGGLSLGGAGLGAAGLAALMSYLKADNARYGTPGRQDNVGAMGQFKYNPASFSATRPDPSMFRALGVPTAKVGYADGGPIQVGQNGPMEQQQQVPTPDAVPSYMNSNVVMMARGGISSLGGYSDGGRMLKGPGDGMSDSIPASIAGKQPARLADSEFVVPADVVSHLGNGSSDAGAKKLYQMMDKVRQARTGRKTQGKQINADKFLPR
jgi:hypothetical protein